MCIRDSQSIGESETKVFLTGSGGLLIAKLLGLDFVQEVIATKQAVSELLPNTDVVIELGGEDAKILYLTNGLEQRMNGTCAGGTGSFIDQMAGLLKTDAKGLNELAENHKNIYPIAARCGVFAKSDVQPLLNEGAAKEDIAASILQAVVTQTISGLSQGRPIAGNLSLIHILTPTGFGNPRRMSSGIDLNRVILLIAVLEKRARVNLSNSDVYINVAGGLRIDETAADLGICAAIVTGQTDTQIPPDMIFAGEVGLGGELRAVSQLEKRLGEAAKLGFKSAIVPKPVSYTHLVERAAYDMVSGTRQVLNSSASDKNNAVLLKIMTYSRNVSRNLDAVCKSDSGNLTKR